MGTMTIEPAENVTSHRCEDCAETYRRVYGFVNDDGAAYAVYNGALHEGHAESEVCLTVTIGGWGGGDPAQRRSVNLLIRKPGGQVGVMVTDAERSHWRSSATLGRFLDRDEALASVDISAYFEVADQVIQGDPRVRDYLANA
jgi:hypothetical protein